MKGKILWVSQRDGNGIIVDENKNEYYFNIPAIEPDLKRNDLVSFEINTNIKDCLCAKNVRSEYIAKVIPKEFFLNPPTGISKKEWKALMNVK